MDNNPSCQLSQENISTESDAIGDSKSFRGSELDAYIICPKKISFPSDIDEHKRTHSKEMPNYDTTKHNVSQEKVLIKSSKNLHAKKTSSCKICLKTFQCDSMERHRRVHTGEKPFECDICKKRFGLRGELTKHIRTHTGEKPFECDFCKKRFSQTGALGNHIRTHTGENPFICGVCHKGFAKKYNLVNHIRTHTGERPYECDICEVSFTEKRSLQRHINNHGPFSCDVCHKTFDKKRVLTMHVKTHAIDNSLRPKSQESFSIDSSNSFNAGFAFNLEESFEEYKDAKGNIPFMPENVNIKSENEDIDLKYDPVMVVTDMEVKIEDNGFQEEMF